MKRSLDKGFIFLILIIITIAGIGLTLYFRLRTDALTNRLESKPLIATVFVIGRQDEASLIQILFIDSRTNKGFLLDVPPNTGGIIESLNRVDKIEVLFSPDNLNPLREKIASLVDQELPFHFYIDFEYLEDIIDLCGGIELFIPNSYEKIEENNIVLLPAGNVVLDGEKAKDYIRYSQEGERELEKIDRKHKFLQALLRAFSHNNAFLQNSELLSMLNKRISTNLDKRSLSRYLEEISRLDVERIGKRRVLGNIRLVDDQELLFPHFEGELLKQTVSQNLEALASSDTRAEGELVISLELLNGTTVTGLARRTKDLFENFGFDVVSFTNAESNDIEKTTVIDRSGDISNAQRVAEIIRCSRIQTNLEDENEYNADVTVILGKDFDGRYVKD